MFAGSAAATGRLIGEVKNIVYAFHDVSRVCKMNAYNVYMYLMRMYISISDHPHSIIWFVVISCLVFYFKFKYYILQIAHNSICTLPSQCLL